MPRVELSPGVVPVEQLANDLGVPAEQLDQALRSLVDYVQTHPEALLLGKHKAKER